MKRFNINELFKFIIMVGFTFYFYYLVLTDKLNLFINPKMVKYIIFASIFFTILTVYQFTKVFTVKTKKSVNISYILMLLTLLIGFYATQTSLNPNVANKKGINNNFSFINSKINKSNTTVKPIVESSNSIIFTDENYFKNLYDIGEDLYKKYKGTKIVIDGFIYKEDTLEKDEFIIARLMMACCAADSQVIGLVCKYPDTLNLKQNTWFKVEGILDFKNNVPIILVNKLTSIPKPKNLYVYPFN
ncbi:TIGR03943 family putative permease subunit [Clostridium tetani]|uniref:TIGR03943 family putative permease subunit n=1 Tax=Clostridium tetani TaxID=1513 RepID=UPI000513CBE6|nr:TIGR03943 family protein [Clostridium tetani]KGI40465.1 membrane protein [Clostridium tetani ATCC 9441]RXM72565.1 TIGR03943 family protein [Clostridium tetani]BDR63834.1 TIGR03943 family protein [Clostridium tetani]SUY65972.1 membrane-spanning protein [Clostridium tetani]